MNKADIDELKRSVETMRKIARHIEEHADHPENSADTIEKALKIEASNEGRLKAQDVILSFILSYLQKPESTPDAIWLDKEFEKYPSLWQDAEDRKNTVLTIVEHVQRFEEEKNKLTEYRERGLSRESYLKSVIEDGAKTQGISDIGSYAAEIDHALNHANKENIDLICKRDGEIKQPRHLDDFISKQYEWNDVNSKAIAKNIGQKAGIAAMLSVGIQGKSIFGSSNQNRLTGQANNSIEEEATKFVGDALKSRTNTGLSTVISGGIVLACKSGWLGERLKNTSTGQIANAVCVGIEYLKILANLGSGKINTAEAINQAGDVTCCIIGSLVRGVDAVSLGSRIGSAFGPHGACIGGIVGGLVGEMAGSTFDRALRKGAKVIEKNMANDIRTLASGLMEGVNRTHLRSGNAIGNFSF